jgi:prepilin-type N-terminal cleavage/methylation domain-containing protein
MRKRQSAMTLLEVMIVVAILADVMIIAIPGLVRAKQSGQNAKFEENLRIAASAFQMYYVENGKWPPSAATGVVPPGMALYMKGMDFTELTPLGGQLKWDYNPATRQAGISTTITPDDQLRMQRVDAQLDDGVLTTGSFRSLSPNTYTYYLEF